MLQYYSFLVSVLQFAWLKGFSFIFSLFYSVLQKQIMVKKNSYLPDLR